MDKAWEASEGGYWRRMGRGGVRLLVTPPLSCGWDASATWPSGETVRAPRYFASKKSAQAWCDRQVAA